MQERYSRVPRLSDTLSAKGTKGKWRYAAKGTKGKWRYAMLKGPKGNGDMQANGTKGKWRYASSTRYSAK